MIKILIVDDEKPICDLIDLNLSSAGYHCISVQDGLKAINRIEEEDFDLVLLDIEMPGMNGIETFEQMKGKYDEIPVIFLTASGYEDDVMSAIRLGAVNYLKKPFLPQDLLERIEKEFEKK